MDGQSGGNNWSWLGNAFNAYGAVHSGYLQKDIADKHLQMQREANSTRLFRTNVGNAESDGSGKWILGVMGAIFVVVLMGGFFLMSQKNK